MKFVDGLMRLKIPLTASFSFFFTLVPLFSQPGTTMRKATKLTSGIVILTRERRFTIGSCWSTIKRVSLADLKFLTCYINNIEITNQSILYMFQNPHFYKLILTHLFCEYRKGAKKMTMMIA